MNTRMKGKFKILSSQKLQSRYYVCNFDGLLTKVTYDKLMHDNFYLSLFVNPNSYKFNNAITQMKDNEVIDAIVHAHLHDEMSDYRLTRNAVSFLTEMLHYSSEIIILSRNRKEYIQALLRLERFTEDEINRIIICDTNTLYFGKINYISTNEEAMKNPAYVTYVLSFEFPDNRKIYDLFRYSETSHVYPRNVTHENFDTNKLLEIEYLRNQLLSYRKIFLENVLNELKVDNPVQSNLNNAMISLLDCFDIIEAGLGKSFQTIESINQAIRDQCDNLVAVSEQLHNSQWFNFLSTNMIKKNVTKACDLTINVSIQNYRKPETR